MDNEHYSSHDEILLIIDANVADKIDNELMSKLYKARFGYEVGTKDFIGRYGVDEEHWIADIEYYLKEHKIVYTRKLIKANIDIYVSNT